MASKKKYYAIAVGRIRGILTQWYGANGAEKQVQGYPGARYKGFATLAEAESFLEQNPERPKARPSKKQRQGTRTPRPQTTPPKPLEPPQKRGQIVMYTDGGALSNPGPGGYGVVIVNGSRTKEFSKGYRMTTNNRMELMACIAGLQHLKKPSHVKLYSDSKYVVNGITKGWAQKWQKNDWMRTKTEPAINPDLWEQLLVLCAKHRVAFQWVKGHAGNAGNERCDELATRAARGKNLAVDRFYEKERR